MARGRAGVEAEMVDRRGLAVPEGESRRGAATWTETPGRLPGPASFALRARPLPAEPTREVGCVARRPRAHIADARGSGPTGRS